MSSHGARRASNPRSFALFLTMFATLAIPSFAEEVDDSPLKAGAWAASFDWIVDGSQSVYGFNVKRHVSPSSALRVGIGFDLAESQEDGIAYGLGGMYSPPDPRDATVTSDDQAVSVFAEWVGYKPVADRMSIFLGIGPSFGYSRRRYVDISSSPTFYREYTYGTARRNVGLQGHVGFEWLFTKRLSLAGQIATMAVYEWGNTDSFDYVEITSPSFYRDGNRRRSDLEGVRFRTGRAGFMLTAYL